MEHAKNKQTNKQANKNRIVYKIAWVCDSVI